MSGVTFTVSVTWFTLHSHCVSPPLLRALDKMREAKRAIEIRLEPLDEKIRAGDKEVGAEWEMGGKGWDGTKYELFIASTCPIPPPSPLITPQAVQELEKGEAELEDLSACMQAVADKVWGREAG